MPDFEASTLVATTEVNTPTEKRYRRVQTWLKANRRSALNRRQQENYGRWDRQPGQPPRRVIAIGDIHGDITMFKYILKNSGMYDADKKIWLGGDTIIVQLGDMMDAQRDGTVLPQDTEWALFELVNDIQNAISRTSSLGAMVRLLGNHEMWYYTIGPHNNYVAPAQMLFHNQSEMRRNRDFMPNSLLAQALALQCYLNVIIDGVLYGHAGWSDEFITASTWHLDSPPKHIVPATEMVQYFNAMVYKALYHGTESFTAEMMTVWDELLNTEYGPLWSRPGALYPNQNSQFSRAFWHRRGLQAMVVGHNPVHQICTLPGNDWFILCDVMLSRIFHPHHNQSNMLNQYQYLRNWQDKGDQFPDYPSGSAELGFYWQVISGKVGARGIKHTNLAPFNAIKPSN